MEGEGDVNVKGWMDSWRVREGHPVQGRHKKAATEGKQASVHVLWGRVWAGWVQVCGPVWAGGERQSKRPWRTLLHA